MKSAVKAATARLTTNDFVRAKTDEKQYSLFTLENGLEVLLVADQRQDDEPDDESSLEVEDDDEADDLKEASLPSEDADDESGAGESHGDRRKGFGGCAVAMAVGVGSFHEEFGVEPHGLAHLLEHMLFMGSQKYPVENAYDDHLSKHGGYSNAFTEAECTMYYFEVPQPGLHQALDIFAQFFISPLMLKDSLDREINAVDSEFDTVLGDDDLRMKAVWRLGTVSETHPYARFCWGNSASLRLPMSSGKELTELLRDFYIKHYHVENMKLVVWSQDDLETLERVVRESFNAIPARPDQSLVSAPSSNLPSIDSKALGAMPLPFSTKNALGFIHRIVPVHDTHVLRLTWQHEPLKSYRSRPATYVAHLLGHESSGGVLAYLKRNKWASDLWAGTSEDDGHENSSMCALFSVEVKLTQDGVENFDKVILAVFAYLGMLRTCGPQRWVFDEVKQTALAAFEYKDEGEPSAEVGDLAVNLLPKSGIVDRRDILAADHILFDFDERDIVLLMDALGCEGAHAPRVDIASSIFGREHDYASSSSNINIKTIEGEPIVEEYWGARLWRQEIPKEVVNAMRMALSKGASFDETMRFTLPPRNEYIVENLEVFPLESARLKINAARAIHPLVGCRIEVMARLGKQRRRVWAGGVVAQGSRQADGLVRLRVEFEAGEPNMEIVTCGEESYPSTANNVLVFDHATSGEKVELRVIYPALPCAPTLLVGSMASESKIVEVFPEKREKKQNEKRKDNPLANRHQNEQKTTASILPDKHGIRLFWLQDATFSVPRAALFLVVRLPAIGSSLRSRSLLDLVAMLATHELDHEAYLAKMAELDVQIKVHDDGLVLTVLGFSEKLLGLVDRALTTLMRFLSLDFDPSGELKSVIDLELESLVRNLANAENETDVQANNIRLQCLVPGTFSKRALATDLAELRRTGLPHKDFLPKIITEDISVDALYHGNVNRSEANKAVPVLRRALSEAKRKSSVRGEASSSAKASSARGSSTRKRMRVVEMARGSLNCVVVAAHEPSEKTSAIQLYYELCEDTPENQALGEALEHMLDEPLFDELRTKQQLGYIVSCGLRRTHGILGLAVEITSSKYPPSECLDRFEAFLKDFRENELPSLSDSELRNRLEGIARRILQKDSGIFQETKRHWHTIFEQSFNFGEKWLVVHHLLHAPKSNSKYGVSLKEVIHFFDETLGAKTRRALLVVVVGAGNRDLTTLEKETAALQNRPGATLFESPDSFWAAHPTLFPLACLE